MSRVTPVLLYSLTGAVVLSSLSSCKEKKSEEVKKTMNVVYIMCDDHSYQTISAYDQRYMQTPNIDRIASEGVRFTNSFVANSLSGPSRACMLTGKHSHANGFTDNTTTFDGNQQTFPKLLQANGYQTAMIGKWHLVSEPTGFNYWDILIGQGDYYNPKFIKNGQREAVRYCASGNTPHKPAHSMSYDKALSQNARLLYKCLPSHKRLSNKDSNWDERDSQSLPRY